MTYQAILDTLFRDLGARGWALSAPTLKIRHATHPTGVRLWFKPRGLWVGSTTSIADARSLWLDVKAAAAGRPVTLAEFVESDALKAVRE